MQLKILEKYTGSRVDIALSEMLNISRSVISKIYKMKIFYYMEKV